MQSARSAQQANMQKVELVRLARRGRLALQGARSARRATLGLSRGAMEQGVVRLVRRALLRYRYAVRFARMDKVGLEALMMDLT